MANTTIQLKKSLIPGNAPSYLEHGELALNAADGVLFYKDPNNVIQQIRSDTTSNSFSTINVGSTLLVATTPNDILSISGNNGINLTGNFITDSIVIDIDSANTTQKGVVQLYDGFDSTSISLGATANSVNAAYTLAKLAYDNSGGAISINLVPYSIQEYVTSAYETEFTVSAGYDIGYVNVYLNGVLLNTNDFTANNGLSITLNEPTSNNDVITIGSWYGASNSGSYLGNLIVTGNTTSNSFVLPESTISSNTFVTLSNTANQVIDAFSTTSYRSAKYTIQVTSNSSYQTSEILVLHNGTNSFITEYGVVTTNSILMNYDTDVDSGYARLLATPVDSINTIKILKTYIEV